MRAAFREAHALAGTSAEYSREFKRLGLQGSCPRSSRVYIISHRGNLPLPTRSWNAALALCEDSEAAAYLDLSAQDPRVHVRSYDGMALWFLGFPDQALRICAEARRCADASQHPFSEAMARTISLRVHQFRGETAVVAAQANAAIAFCEEHEFVHCVAMALILRGWASAQQASLRKVSPRFREGLEKERATGALLL